jgi:excisionase family DNA binding protein
MASTVPVFSVCEQHTLDQIKEKFGLVVWLTVNEFAEILRTSGNNVIQMIRRGHLTFSTARVGSSYRFPCAAVAQWVCGKFNEDAACVAMPKKTSGRVKTQSEFQKRLMALKNDVDDRVKRVRELDDQTGFKKAKIEHEKASFELVKLVESQALSDFVGVPLDTPKKSRGGL